MVLPQGGIIPGTRRPSGGVGASNIADLTGLDAGELIVGGAGGPTALALPSYGQELRRRGTNLNFLPGKEAHIADRNDIDKTGVADQQALFATYLDEYKTAGYATVYLDPGTYKFNSQLALPIDFRLIGPGDGSGTSVGGAAATIIAGAADIDGILRLTSHNVVSGVKINCGSGLENVHGVRATGIGAVVKDTWFGGGTSASYGITTGNPARTEPGALYLDVLKCTWSNFAGKALHFDKGPSYYGVNGALIDDCAFGGNPEGVMYLVGFATMRDCAIEYNHGNAANPIIHVDGTPVSSGLGIEGGYMEMSGSALVDAIRANGQGSLWMEGGNTDSRTEGGLAGTIAVNFQSTGALSMRGVGVLPVETGIKFSAGVTPKLVHIEQIDWHADVVTRMVDAPTSLTTSSGGAFPPLHGYLENDGKALFRQAVVSPVVQHNMGSHGATLNLALGNSFLIESPTASALGVTNATPGQVVTIVNQYNSTAPVLLGTAFKSADWEQGYIAPQQGRTFLVTGDGFLIEAGGHRPVMEEKTANFSATDAVDIYRCNCTEGNITVTLPDGRDTRRNQARPKVFIKSDASANTVSFDGFDAQNVVVGAAWNNALTKPGDFVWLYCDATSDNVHTSVWWDVVGGNVLPRALRVDGDLDHNGTLAGFYGATPVAKPTALTAADNTAIDATYDATEQAVLGNVRTRLNELETKLQALGLLT